MKVSTLISLAFLTSVVSGCAESPKRSLLEERANYGTNAPPFALKDSKENVRYVPTRVPEKITIAWLHQHELPSKDYFWGSWLSIIVEPEGWEMLKVDKPKAENRGGPKTQERPKSAPPKKR